MAKPPGRSLMSVRGNAAPRGMTAHDRIRLTGPFAEFTDSPGREPIPAGADHFPSVPCSFRLFHSQPPKTRAVNQVRHPLSTYFFVATVVTA